MPVFMRYREHRCKKCKGPGGWKRLKAGLPISWHANEAAYSKPVIETEWVTCPRCKGDGRVHIGGPLSGVLKVLATTCK